MSSIKTRLDELDIAFSSRSAIHEYCNRLRKLGNDLAVECQLSSKDLQRRLLVTPLADPTLINKAVKFWTAKKVASGLWLAGELAAAIAHNAVKVALLFDQHYVNVVRVNSAPRQAVKPIAINK